MSTGPKDIMAFSQSFSEELDRNEEDIESSYHSKGYEKDTEQLLNKAVKCPSCIRQERTNICTLSRSSKCIWLGNAVILCISIAFFAAGLFTQRNLTNQECAVHLSAYSPALEGVEYEMRRFEGSVQRENTYKGPPTPERDEAWKKIVNLGSVKINASDMVSLRKPLTQVKINENGHDQYMAGVEVFHQLHCLQLVRQFTYYDHYSKLDPPPMPFRDSKVELRQHVDHCIDMIRQVIQCNGDAGLYTHSWVTFRDLPYPDFASWHKCRKLEPLHDFIEHNGFPRWPEKSEAEVVLERPPCEGVQSNQDCP